MLTVGGGVAAATVTLAVPAPLPPGPVQVSVKVLVPAVVSAGVVSVPELARLPVQPPLAVQAVALVAFQLSWVVPPFATLEGFAESATVGTGGSTVTFALAAAEPPGPVQLSEKVALAVSTSLVALPLVALVPLQAPEAAQEVLSVADQVS
ncbi:MAG: hypothetical protein U1F11_12355 [Steroidobacteraceae bacterium]